MRIRTWGELLKETFREWNNDNAARLSAALSYYTVFSIAPLLIIIIAIAGYFFGRQAVEGQVVTELRDLVGVKSAEMIQSAIQSASAKPAHGVVSTIIGGLVILFGASGVFGELQSSLNLIWNVKPKGERTWGAVIKDRFISFTTVLGIGFLLIVSLIISAAIAALGKYFSDILPVPEMTLEWANFILSFAVITVLFALMYKVLPDAKIAWKDVWIGALMTAFLFSVGKFLIGFYLGKSTAASAYGAAGAILVILLWAYYTSMIMFFGAEFTQVYANHFGSGLIPKEHAEIVEKEPEPARV